MYGPLVGLYVPQNYHSFWILFAEKIGWFLGLNKWLKTCILKSWDTTFNLKKILVKKKLQTQNYCNDQMILEHLELDFFL